MKYRTILGVAASAMLAAGCDAGSFTGSEPLETPVAITVDVANMIIGGVSVEVTGPGIPQPIVATLPVTSGVAEGQVRVLSGADRAFLIRAFDPQGLETHRGADTVDIAGNSSQTLAVSLTPLTGEVDVDARVGEYTLVVSASDSTLTVGESANAQVVVTDAAGNAVDGAVVTWGSSNPAVASVDTAGLVQALVPGETVIGASYQGFGGTMTVLVTQ